MDLSIASITDGRFSDTTRGAAVGRVSPKATATGTIALVNGYDMISDQYRK